MNKNIISFNDKEICALHDVLCGGPGKDDTTNKRVFKKVEIADQQMHARQLKNESMRRQKRLQSWRT